MEDSPIVKVHVELVPCSACDGNGFVPYTEIDCPECAGRGFVPCASPGDKTLSTEQYEELLKKGLFHDG